MIRSGIRVLLSDKEAELWFTDTDGLLLEPRVIERGQQQMASGAHQARLRGEDYYHTRRDGQKLKDFLGEQIAMGNPVWRGFQEDRWPQGMDIYIVFFEKAR